MGSPKWHALPEFREHVFECEEPSCVRDVRDSAPLLRLGPLPPERCETRRWPQQGQLARRARAIHHMDRCAPRTGWDLYARVDDHRIVGTLARFSTPQQRILEKFFFCLTGPYLTRRATIGWLELPLGRGRFVGPPLRATPTSITAYTARGTSV